MKKLILILALMFCLIFSFNTLAFEKVDVTGTNFDTTVIFVAKIQTFLDHGLGTSTTVVAYEEGEPILQVWSTCDSVDGATIATPVYVHSILTGLGAVGRAAEFVLAPIAQMGGYGNAVKALLDVSSTNGSVGLLSGLCAEVVTPATALSGTLACVEHEIVATEGLTVNPVIGSANTINFMQFALSGHIDAVEQVDNYGQFFILNGVTPLIGNMLSANYLTLKTGINEFAKYLVLSHDEDMLSIGTSIAPITIAAATPKLAVYTTYPDAGTGIIGTYFETEMAGIGGAGVASMVYLKTNVALGNYVAAFYAMLDLETAGGVTGVGSAICGELIMPGGAAGIGTYGILKLDVVCPASWTSSQRVAIIRGQASGDTAAKFVTEGYLFDLAGMGTATEDVPAIFHLCKAADVAAATHALRIAVDGVEYDIPLVVTAYSTD